MNQNNYNLKLLSGQLAMVLEALEDYIREGKYYSDWASKEQFYSRTASVYKISLEVAEGGFFSQFSAASTLFFNAEKYRNSCREIQKEFYKWIDHSGITVENCPEKLKHYLININEALENGNSELYQAYQTVIKEENSKIEPLEKSPFFWQASREVDRELGCAFELPISEAKNYELEIKGNAERGQQTFQQIKNSIVSQPEWAFPINGENYTRKVEEKIRELEAKKVQPHVKEPQRKETIHHTFEDILRDVEIYISKLNYYPNWKISEWNGEGEEDYVLKKSKDESAEEIKDGTLSIGLKCISQVLRFLKRDYSNYYSHLVEELKIKFSQWQSEREIDPNNCPEQLEEVLSTINEILANGGNFWRGWKESKDDKRGNNEKQQEEIIKIIIELKLEIDELTKKYKIRDLVSNDWKDKLMNAKSLTEAKSYQREIEKNIQAEKKKHQVPTATNESGSKLSWPVKIAILGCGILIAIGTIIMIYRIVKTKKVKK